MQQQQGATSTRTQVQLVALEMKSIGKLSFEFKPLGLKETF